MAISQGTYTIGATGANYATVMQAFYDISSSGLTGNLTFNIISDCQWYPNSYTPPTAYKDLKGYTLTITSTVYHNGYFGSHAPTITAGVGSIGLPGSSILGIGGNSSDNSKIIISNCQFIVTDTSSSGGFLEFNFNVSGGDNPNATVFIYNNLFNYSSSTTITRCITFTTSIGFDWLRLYIYRNVFLKHGFAGTTSISVLTIARSFWNGVCYVENNTFFQCRHALSGDATSVKYFRNNLFYCIGSVFNNATPYGFYYNNATNLASWSGYTGSGNLAGLTFDGVNGDSYIESYTATNPKFGQLKTGTVLTNSGTIAGLYVGNTLGIRLNAAPNPLGQMSIGADQFFYIEFISLGGAALPYPKYPYETQINYGWDIVESRTGKLNYFDNTSSYDRRSCKATFLMSPSEAEAFKVFWNAYKTSYSSTALDLVMNTDSGWFPFGQDKGNVGTFKVEVNMLSKLELSKTHFNYYEVTLELINVGAYPSYNFVSEVNEGSFSIADNATIYSPVSYIRTPIFDANGMYGTYTTQNEGFTNYNKTIELNGETQDTTFQLVTNLSKMQRVLKLLTDNRTNKYKISDGGGNIFGYSFSTVQSNLSLLDNKFTVVANSFNDYTLTLRLTNNA